MPDRFSRAWVACAALATLPAPVPARAQSTALLFHAVTPCRILDTRTGAQGGVLATNTPEPAPPAPPTASSVTRTYPVRGLCAIPADAQVLAFNVTVVPVVGQAFAGHLTLFSGAVLPTASNLNFAPSQTTANGGVVQLGTAPDKDLRIKLFAAAAVGAQAHLLLDATGYFAP